MVANARISDVLSIDVKPGHDKHLTQVLLPFHCHCHESAQQIHTRKGNMSESGSEQNKADKKRYVLASYHVGFPY
jgi:hypothetical protein